MMPALLAVIFILFFFVPSALSAERYKEPIFEVEKIPNLVYASGVPHLAKKHMITSLVSGLKTSSNDIPVLWFYQNDNETKDEDLRFDLYQPQNDTAKRRPLVIIVHGGAFVSGGRDDQNQPIVAYSDSLAARGYVVASIDYRIGLALKTVGNQLLIDSVDFKRSVLWGVQDLQAAIQYFKVNAKDYGINPNRIFVVGCSSGAILALQSIIENKKTKPDAVISLWGAVMDKVQIKNISVPVLLVHGTRDEIIPFKEGRMLNLDSVKEKNSYMPGYGSAAKAFNIKFSSPIFYGSFVIDSVLNNRRINHESFFVEGEGHEFYGKEPYKADVLKRLVEFLYKNLQ